MESNYTLEIIANDFGANYDIYSNQSRPGDDERNKCFVFIEIIDVNNKKPEFMSGIK